jgi:hypothetical protein
MSKWRYMLLGWLVWKLGSVDSAASSTSLVADSGGVPLDNQWFATAMSPAMPAA